MQKVVIKIGTSTLTRGSSKLSRRSMLALVEQCVQLHEKGVQLILVSSGAEAAGRNHLCLTEKERSSSLKPLCASTGQVILMQTWLELFSLFDLNVGQVLVTRDDFFDLNKQESTKEILVSMLRHRVVPIVNENDTVSSVESRIGDNDNLAALLARLIKVDAVILLTDQEGLYTADPRMNPNAKFIEKVERLDAELFSFASSFSALGTGGMATKIEAAQVASQSGIRTIIAPSFRQNVLVDLFEGKQIGTVFMEETR